MSRCCTVRLCISLTIYIAVCRCTTQCSLFQTIYIAVCRCTTQCSLVNVRRCFRPSHLFHPEALPCSSPSLLYTEDGSVIAHRNTACVCTPQSQQLSLLSCSITAIPVHQARPHCCTLVLFCRQLHADDDRSAPPIRHRRQGG